MMLRRIGFMAFIGTGTLIMKSGALLFGFKSFMDNEIPDAHILGYVGSVVAIISTAHVIMFTRGAYLWKIMYSSQNIPQALNVEEEKFNSNAKVAKIGKISACVAVLNGIGLIPVLSYVGAREILAFFGSNEKIAIYMLFTYCLLSDFIAYLSFTTKITIENSKRLYIDFILHRDEQGVGPLGKTFAISLLGFLSNMSFNYFVARSALSDLSVSPAITIALSSTIAILSGTITFVSKSGKIYNYLSGKHQEHGYQKIDRAVDKVTIVYHKVVGVAYLFCFGCAYYIACVKNASHFGVDINQLAERVPLEILSVFTALSAVYMEYALSYRSMLAESRGRIVSGLQQHSLLSDLASKKSYGDQKLVSGSKDDLETSRVMGTLQSK